MGAFSLSSSFLLLTLTLMQSAEAIPQIHLPQSIPTVFATGQPFNNLTSIPSGAPSGAFPDRGNSKRAIPTNVPESIATFFPTGTRPAGAPISLPSGPTPSGVPASIVSLLETKSLAAPTNAAALTQRALPSNVPASAASIFASLSAAGSLPNNLPSNFLGPRPAGASMNLPSNFPQSLRPAGASSNLLTGMPTLEPACAPTSFPTSLIKLAKKSVPNRFGGGVPSTIPASIESIELFRKIATETGKASGSGGPRATGV